MTDGGDGLDHVAGNVTVAEIENGMMTKKEAVTEKRVVIGPETENVNGTGIVAVITAVATVETEIENMIEIATKG